MVINAIMWTFGMTKTEAKKYYREHKSDKRLLTYIVEGYSKTAHKAFMED